MKYTDREFVRFLIAGAVNTALGYLLYCALLLVATYPVAYTVSYAAGIFISYMLNCMFVFKLRPSFRSALQFPLVYVVQYMVGMFLLMLFVRRLHLDPRIAALGVILFTIPLTFILSRYILRRAPERSL